MARRIHEIAPGQMALDFSAKVETFLEVKGNLFEAIHDRPTAPELENEFECCIEIVAAIKKALRESNMNREQLVDAINAYSAARTKGPTPTRPPAANP